MVGISATAMTALRLAAEQPQRVSHVIVAGGYADARIQDAKIAEIVRAEGQRMRDDWPAYLAWFFDIVFTEPHSTKQIEDTIGWGLETTPETMILTEAAPALDPDDYRELCASLTCPVLVVHGDEDGIVPYAEGVALAAATGARLVTFAGSGHCLQARDPVRFNLLLREFAEVGL